MMWSGRHDCQQRSTKLCPMPSFRPVDQAFPRYYGRYTSHSVQPSRRHEGSPVQLTITTTHHPATDLGYLAAQESRPPAILHCIVGQAHVFYPEATAERCTAALLLDVDPIGLVRKRRWAGGERLRPGAVCQRPPLCRLVVSQRRHRRCVRHAPWAAAARIVPELAATPDPARGDLTRRALPRRRGLPAPPLRAAGLRRRHHAASARRSISRLGREPLLTR